MRDSIVGSICSYLIPLPRGLYRIRPERILMLSKAIALEFPRGRLQKERLRSGRHHLWWIWVRSPWSKRLEKGNLLSSTCRQCWNHSSQIHRANRYPHYLRECPLFNWSSEPTPNIVPDGPSLYKCIRSDNHFEFISIPVSPSPIREAF